MHAARSDTLVTLDKQAERRRGSDAERRTLHRRLHRSLVADSFGLACLLQCLFCVRAEKIVISCAKKFIIIADSRKDSSKLGQQVC